MCPTPPPITDHHPSVHHPHQQQQQQHHQHRLLHRHHSPPPSSTPTATSPSSHSAAPDPARLRRPASSSLQHFTSRLSSTARRMSQSTERLTSRLSSARRASRRSQPASSFPSLSNNVTNDNDDNNNNNNSNNNNNNNNNKTLPTVSTPSLTHNQSHRSYFRNQRRSSSSSSSTWGHSESRHKPTSVSPPSISHHMDALVTLFKRDASSEKSSNGGEVDELDDTVAMSPAGQRVIPAVFNLEPFEPPCPSSSVSSASCNPSTTTNSSSSSSSKTPDSSEFSQAGGHNNSFHSDGATLVKKVTEREASFYEGAQNGHWPASLLPKYYGRVGGDAIKIENLTHGFSRPCVIDLKLGVQTVEDTGTSLLKKLKMNALDRITGTRSAGCRLEGLSMHRTLDNKFIKGTKSQSHFLSFNVNVSLQDVLTFFLTDESGVRTDVALRFQTGVETILRQFEKNDSFRFIGSSILLIYNNDNNQPYMHWARALRKLHRIAPHVRLSEDQISGLTRRTRCDVRMIDFAHTGPMPADMKRDEGYITGLRTILAALKAIRVYRNKPIFSVANAVVDLMEQVRAEKQKDGSNTDEFTFESVLNELTAMSAQRLPNVATAQHEGEEEEEQQQQA